MTQQPSTWGTLLRLLVKSWDPQTPDLPHPISWSDIAPLARSSGVIPLVHSVARQWNLAIPTGLQESLLQVCYEVAANNTYYLENLKQLAATLASVDIQLLLVKGGALAQMLYADAALRPMADLDLVIRTQDMPTCLELFTGLGYVAASVELTSDSDIDYHSAQVFIPGEAFHAPVGLHWHLLDIPYYIRNVPMEWFWENTDTIEIAGHPVRVLTPEANLLYLPAHLALHHRFHGLRWFVDLAMLVHKYQGTLDWDTVIGKAQEFELLLVLRETLDRLHAYWPSLPLDEPRRRLHALEPTPFEARLFRLLTAEPRSPLLDFYTDLLCLPDRPARNRFVLLNLFPQRAYMARRYGAERTWQLPYWYLYRLGDGLVKLARTLPQVLRLHQGFKENSTLCL